MGLFDFLSKKGGDTVAPKTKSLKEIGRLARLAGDKMAQNYDRQEAIEQLSKIGTADAARALVRRFDFSMEPSITDQEEKEAAVEGIAQVGSAALLPLRDYCARAESLMWPMRAIRRIVPEDALVDEFLGLLDLFDTEYMRNPEPKVQLISVLEDHRSDEVLEAVEPFLTDVNESVRFHAVGTVFAMDRDSSVEALIAAMVDEESLRVKNRIAGGLSQREWPIPEALMDAAAQALPPEFELSGSKIVRA